MTIKRKKSTQVYPFAVVEGKLSVYLQRRPENMRAYPLFWVVPGGKVDAGETYEDAGKREMKEETGYMPTSLFPMGHVDTETQAKDGSMRYYRINKQGTKVDDPSALRINSEGEADQDGWFTIEQALEMKLPPKVKETLTSLMDCNSIGDIENSVS